MRNVAYLILTALMLTVLSPSLAFAYVGPGAGLSALGSLLALFGALALGVIGFLWYPLRRLLRYFQSTKAKTSKAAE